MIPSKGTTRPDGGGPARALELWSESAPPWSLQAQALRATVALARRDAIWIATVALAVAILSGVAFRMIFDQYVATATILFDPRNAKVTSTEEVLPDIGPDSIAIESRVQVARSDSFLAALVEREGLADNPEFAGGATAAAERSAAAIDRLRERLTIGRRGATYVVDVSVRTSGAQESARIANAAAAMMVDNEASLRSGSNQRAADLIGGKLEQLRARVSGEDAAIARLKTELKITDAGQGEALQARRITELSQQHALADARASETKALVDQLREANFTAGALPSAIQSPVLNGLRADYVRLTREAADRETVLGARHPDVIATNAQLGDVRRQIAAEKDRLIASARADYLEARKRETSLAEELRKAQADSGATDEQAVALRDLERTEKSDQAVYEQLLDRQKALSEMKGLSSDDVRIVSPATAPTRTNMPRLPLVLLASASIGLLAGFGGAFARDAWRRPAPPAPAGEAVVEAEALAPPPSGAEAQPIVPRFPYPPFRDGRVPDRETARWFERICASALVRSVARGGVVLVTSPRGGEGKSTVASNVAACFARAGAETLLIQTAPPDRGARGDEIGLVEVATGNCTPQEAVVSSREGAPSLLPFGGARSYGAAGAGEPLSVSALRRAIHDCRQSFETVVIDAPSALAWPALRILARRADVILLVVEWNQTDPARVEEALDSFERRKVVVVFNKVDLARYAEAPPLAGELTPGPAALTGATPAARSSTGLAGWTGRRRRRRSVFDREG